MACLNSLKADIKRLEKTFPKTHDRFQVLTATVDEISCRFISNNGKKYEIHANITETYPSVPPVWFSESDEPIITNVVQLLSNTEGADNHMLRQVKILVEELCRVHTMPLIQDINKLDQIVLNETSNGPSFNCDTITDEIEFDRNSVELVTDEDEDTDEDEMLVYEDLHIEMEEENQNQEKNKDEGLSTEHTQTLERLRQTQRDGYLKGSVSGSVQATDRLMKELKEVYRSESFKRGVFTVDLVNDSLYEWNVKLLIVDPDSQLHNDLQVLKEKEGKDFILLNVLFKEAFPFEPPFVRVVHPSITGGYVLGGGAICMELLTKQGWSSAYTIEAIILQISATLVKGKARIQFGGNKGQYSLARAQQSFKSLVQIHEKNGWFTPPKEDG
ncbi:ubiquitin-conjugating enzyme E2 Q2-like [Oppia nitens]|uniref:ubiquitin-conjugating enzyme E2 Q2-like n=1 Tax=Oppia nitens TaxID=1686743 RepID=UPI0023D989E3|nr:ubiquitin-conjugating enzyme E2 Q2-like [Oppia nitens]